MSNPDQTLATSSNPQLLENVFSPLKTSLTFTEPKRRGAER